MVRRKAKRRSRRQRKFKRRQRGGEYIPGAALWDNFTRPLARKPASIKKDAKFIVDLLGLFAPR